jgi:hypothetical protein
MKSHNDIILEKVSGLFQSGSPSGFITEEGLKKYAELVENAYKIESAMEVKSTKAM